MDLGCLSLNRIKETEYSLENSPILAANYVKQASYKLKPEGCSTFASSARIGSLSPSGVPKKMLLASTSLEEESKLSDLSSLSIDNDILLEG